MCCSRDPLFPDPQPCQLVSGLLTPPLWGRLLVRSSLPCGKHTACLCLAALLPGVSAACACLSARTQYL